MSRHLYHHAFCLPEQNFTEIKQWAVELLPKNDF